MVKKVNVMVFVFLACWLSFFTLSCTNDSLSDSQSDVCKVTFNSNYPVDSEKDAESTTQTIYNSYGTALTANDFQCDGYRFLGWTDDPDSSEVVYADGTSVTVTKDVSFYAVWDLIRDITITFKPNYATSALSDITQKFESVAAGDEVTLLENSLERPGYVFLGWTTGPSSDVSIPEYFDGEQFELTQLSSDMTLYALWCDASDPSLITITFDSNDGSQKKAYQYFKKTEGTAQSVILRKNTFERTGYLFKGWARSAEAKVPAYDDDGTPCELTESTTLYAVWKDTAHNFITYHARSADDGDDSVSEQAVLLAETEVTLQKNTFARDSYYFAGWTDSETDDSVLYTDEETISIAKSLDLYAVWVSASQAVKITFHPNFVPVDGEELPAVVVQYAKKTTAASSVALKTRQYIALRKNTFTRADFVFAGWALSAEAKKAKYDDEDEEFSADSDVTLYALWEKADFTITFDPNLSETEESSADSLKTQVVRKDDDAQPTLALNTFSNSGMRFIGWSDAKTDGSIVYADGDVLSSLADCTLYAVWANESDCVSVVYNSFDSSSRSSFTTYAKKNALVTLRAHTVAREGYSFAGWALSESADAPDYEERAQISLSETNLTLYAVWKNENMYTVSLYASADAEPVLIEVSKAVGKITPEQIAELNLQNDGYLLYGWSSASDAKSIYCEADEDIPVYAEQKLYAVWKETVTVTFDANGGTLASKTAEVSQTVAKSAPYELQSNPFKNNGSIFYGWATSADGARVYIDGAEITTSEDTTLYAIWKSKTATITFEANNGTASSKTISASYDASAANYAYELPKCTASKKGFYFAGWAKTDTVQNASYLYEPLSEQLASEPVTWYAIWLPLSYTLSFDVQESVTPDFSLTQSVSASSDAIDASFAVSVMLPSDLPEIDGMYFWGWSTEKYAPGQLPLEAIDSVIRAGENALLTSDTTYYAVWFKKCGDFVLAKTVSDDSAYSVVSYLGERAVVSLSAPELSNVVIDGIYTNAFKDARFLRRLYLPSSIENVHKNAFAGCVNLVKAFTSASADAISIASVGNDSLISVLIYNVTYYPEQYVTDGKGVFLGYFGTDTSFSINEIVDTVRIYVVAPYAFAFNDTLVDLSFIINDDITVQQNAVTSCDALHKFSIHCTASLLYESVIIKSGAVSDCPVLAKTAFTGNITIYHQKNMASSFVNCPSLSF